MKKNKIFNYYTFKVCVNPFAGEALSENSRKRNGFARCRDCQLCL